MIDKQRSIKRIVLAPDSFKGSFSAEEISNIVQKAGQRHFPDAQFCSMPISDGGEGLISAIRAARGGEIGRMSVCDPLMRPRVAKYLVLDNDTVLLEMAEASGLLLLDPEERNPLLASSFGTGQMIKQALESGFRNIMIGIGGSATNDGGVGLAQALGVEFKTQGSCEMGGGMLPNITGVNMQELNPALKDAKLTVICDVTNVLLGDSGATYTFGAQKGADDKMLGLLEAGMCNLAKVIKEDTGADLSILTGGGAAGGAGAMLTGLLGAEFRQGIEAILDMVEFDRMINDADVVVTGEGRIDSQSADGKVLFGVGRRCKAKGVCALAICGILGDGYEQIFNCGINNVFPAVVRFTDYEQMLVSKETDMQQAADRLFRSLKY